MRKLLPWVVSGLLAYYLIKGVNTARVVGGLQTAVRGIGNLRITGGNVEGVIQQGLFNTSGVGLQIEVIAFAIKVNHQDVGTAWVSHTASADWQRAMFLAPETPKDLPVPFKISLWQLAIAIGAGALSGPDAEVAVRQMQKAAEALEGLAGWDEDANLGAINWRNLWPSVFEFTGRVKGNGFAVEMTPVRFNLPNPFGSGN